jgi:diguanylate cyclase (GGDEF)-like protein
MKVLLEDFGYEVVEAESLADAKEKLRTAAVDLAILDKNLGDGTGLDVAQHMLDRGLDVGCILMSAYTDLDSAIDAMRLGITDYLEKPIPNPDVLRTSIERVRQILELRRKNRELIGELRKKNKLLQVLAVRDPLTKLYNHTYVQDQLQRELLRSSRHNHECSLIMLDIDNFNTLNDRLGTPAGDKLLRLMGELLKGICRRPDVSSRLGGSEIPSRYSGDVFAVLLPETGKTGAAALADRLRTAIADYDFAVHDLPNQTASIGVATYPHDAKDRSELFESAKHALYVSKQTGRNRVVGFRPEYKTWRSRDEEAVALEMREQAALERTIGQSQFRFVYQPIVDANSGEPFAFEALCRPMDEVFPHPGALIEAAERAGRTAALGRALRRGSVAALDKLSQDINLFINIHPQELFDSEFAAIEPFLAPWADQIIFEITEVAKIGEFERVLAILQPIRAMGFRVALDDLGAGYSGLNSLSALRPDFVKLDMKLVRNINKDQRTKRLVRHLIEFADGEGMKVVGEGVETQEERDALIELSCHLLQGYYFGKPKPIDEILSGS